MAKEKMTMAEIWVIADRPHSPGWMAVRNRLVEIYMTEFDFTDREAADCAERFLNGLRG